MLLIKMFDEQQFEFLSPEGQQNVPHSLKLHLLNNWQVPLILQP